MASNFQQAMENDTNNAVANINAAKSVVENGVAKKKAAFSEHDPNLDNKSDEKGKEKEKKQDLAEMMESVFSKEPQGAASSEALTEALKEEMDIKDIPKGDVVDYEAAWANKWIKPLYDNMHQWLEAIARSKERSDRDEEDSLFNGHPEPDHPPEPILSVGIEYEEELPPLDDLDDIPANNISNSTLSEENGNHNGHDEVVNGEESGMKRSESVISIFEGDVFEDYPLDLESPDE